VVISGDASARYSFNGGSYTNAETLVSGGSNTIAVRVTTSATAGGSVEANLSVGGLSVKCVATTRTDLTAPTASILFPPAVSLTEGASVIMRGTVKDEDGGSGVKSLKVNGVAATVDAAKGTWELTAATLADGVNNLKLVVEDLAGNINEDAAHVAVTKGDITQAFPANGGVDFVGPQTVAWDNLDGHNRALVMDVDAKALVAVDLKTGVRIMLSDNTTQPEIPFIYDRTDYNGASIAIDATTKKAYVVNSSKSQSGGVLTVDLQTGSRENTVVGALSSISDLSIDRTNDFNRLFSCSFRQGTVDAWDFASKSWAGGYSDSDGGIPNTELPFENSGGIAVDKVRNRLLMTSFNAPAFIYAIDIKYDQNDPSHDNVRGLRKLFSDASYPSAANQFTSSGNALLPAIRIDEDRSRALVVDRLKPAVIAAALSNDVAKDGERTIFSDNKSVNKLVDPFGLHVEAGIPFALLVDKAQKALIAIDLETGERVFLSKASN
jgi:molybdopterin synthase catalytic subunit